MIKTEQKVVTKTFYEIVPISGKCDVCGKELLPVEKDKLPPNCKDKDIYDYYSITTHHHDWGNDSCESYEYIDCCCINCALSFIQRYWNGCTKSTPWPTLELEMKHEYALKKHSRNYY